MSYGLALLAALIGGAHAGTARAAEPPHAGVVQGAAAVPARAAANPDDAGVILARVAPDVSLVWKTNDAVTKLADSGVSGDALYRAVLARAERIMAEHAGDAAKGRAVTVKLIYVHDAMDPHYKIQTVSGIDSLGTLSASADALRAGGSRWPKALLAGEVPAGLTNAVTRAWTSTVQAK